MLVNYIIIIQTAARLIKAGADIDSRRDTRATPLHAAATVGNVDLIELLLSVSADNIIIHLQMSLHKPNLNRFYSILLNISC